MLDLLLTLMRSREREIAGEKRMVELSKERREIKAAWPYLRLLVLRHPRPYDKFSTMEDFEGADFKPERRFDGIFKASWEVLYKGS